MIEFVESEDLDECFLFVVVDVLYVFLDEVIKFCIECVMLFFEFFDVELLLLIVSLIFECGDVEVGRVVFNMVGICNKCYKILGEGKEVGFDLSEIGLKFFWELMFELIFDLSVGISYNYESYFVMMLDGLIVSGVL